MNIGTFPDEPATVISFRGRYVAGNQVGRNGIKLSVSEEQLPDLVIFTKDPMPRKGEGRVPTIVKVRDPGQTTYTKITLNDTVYSRETDVLYQLTFYSTAVQLRINSYTTLIPKPYRLASDHTYWKIGQVGQVGQATVFKEVSVCPLATQTTILKSWLRPVDCAQGLPCEGEVERTDFLGREMVLVCFVSGVHPLEIRWRKHNGEPLSDLHQITEYQYKTHTVKSSRLVFPVEPDTEGWYSCSGASSLNSSVVSTSHIAVSGYLPLTTHVGYIPPSHYPRRLYTSLSLPT